MKKLLLLDNKCNNNNLIIKDCFLCGILYYPTHTNRKDNMKLEINDKFTIGYFAKKHNKRIFRKGIWNELCREWTSKKGDKLFTYYDITDPTNQGYRTAKGQYTLIAVGGNNE